MDNIQKYQKLGLKVGIEVHQQLDTKKLFCNCPSILRDDAPHFTVMRELRASAGETDEIDVAALHETKKDIYFLYEGYDDTTCLVELDEEPPHDLNREALGVVLQVAKMIDANFVDEIQVMRKMVVDGSNTSGFQRTALVATGGQLKIDGNTIRFPTVCIEEEAAKIIEKTQHSKKYRLDRLGIPLIEIATEPDIKTPMEAKIVCEKIGMILRSTAKVKRGIGTIRQDVNVSIKDGARIEIKGAQDLKLIPTYIEYEIKRQQNLLEIKEELKRRNAKKIEGRIIDVTKILGDTKVPFLKKGIDEKKHILGIRLDSFKGLIKKEEIKNQRLGFEFGTYAKMLSLGGVIHSDEDLTKYGFSDGELKSIEKNLGVQSDDAWLICIGDKNKIETLFLHYIIPRAEKAKEAVPKEVRNANPDGTTTFMRPMPGGARMYPETDVAPIRPDVSNIKLPELLDEKMQRIEKFGLSRDLASFLTKSGRADEFEEYACAFKNLKPAFIAETMIPKMLEIKRKYDVDTEKVTKEELSEIFKELNDARIAKASVETIIIELCSAANTNKGVLQIIEEKNLHLLSDKELEEEIKKILQANKGLEDKHTMGKLMSELKGKAESDKIMEVMKKIKK